MMPTVGIEIERAPRRGVIHVRAPSIAAAQNTEINRAVK
jgi:hypothetical protein